MCASQQDTGKDPASASGPAPATERRSGGAPPTASEPPTGNGQVPASEAMLPSEPLPTGELLPRNESLPESESPTASEPTTASGPPNASERPPGGDLTQRLAQAETVDSASAAGSAAGLLDTSLIVIGAALFVCALATLTLTWVWSWHAGSAGTFNLSRMHGICTSAMGELAQGASTNVASHCLWVDGTWTEAVALTGGGFILAVIGIARIVGARRTQT